jgi:protein SCO1/2
MKYVLLILVAATFACIRPKPLPVLAQLPEFHLVDQAGQPFDSRSLNGHVWVANFIYTTCNGPCPMMSSQMHLVQTATADTPGVKLVSFTVDPAHDTPAVLAEYAKRFKYDPARWHFLTGDMACLNDLGLQGFKLNTVDGRLNHSTRFVLVDRQQRIRGYYLSSEDGFLPRLVHDVRQLERDRS